MCASVDGQDTAGGVEECLKDNFNKNTIKNRACRIEVANIIEEAKADIHVDPLLHQACAIDITKFCGEIPQGDGRREYLLIMYEVLVTIWKSTHLPRWTDETSLPVCFRRQLGRPGSRTSERVSLLFSWCGNIKVVAEYMQNLGKNKSGLFRIFMGFWTFRVPREFSLASTFVSPRTIFWFVITECSAKAYKLKCHNGPHLSRYKGFTTLAPFISWQTTILQ